MVKYPCQKRNVAIMIGIVIFAFLLAGCQSAKLRDYDRAKKETIQFLDDNIKELQSISNELLESKGHGQYKNSVDASYQHVGGKTYIQFDVDAQGMLGGQYWGIIYAPNDDLLDGNTSSVYDEKEETGKGNNIFIKERIQDCWYFYYDDYDGKAAN